MEWVPAHSQRAQGGLLPITPQAGGDGWRTIIFAVVLVAFAFLLGRFGEPLTYQLLPAQPITFANPNHFPDSHHQLNPDDFADTYHHADSGDQLHSNGHRDAVPSDCHRGAI